MKEQTTMSSYIQKALARNHHSQDKIFKPFLSEYQETKLDVKPRENGLSPLTDVNNEVRQLADSLINTFHPSQTDNPEDPIQQPPQPIKKNTDITKSLKTNIPLTDLNLKKTELIHVVNLITVKTIKGIKSILRPPQSVVNIIISYVSILSLVDKKKLIITKNKTYANCLKALDKEDYIYQITLELIKYCESAGEDDKKRLKKIRAKYLAGWDMRPEAFSDKYYTARTILHFLILLCDYVDGTEEKKCNRREDSPTRKLIEHKVLETDWNLKERNMSSVRPLETLMNIEKGKLKEQVEVDDKEIKDTIVKKAFTDYSKGNFINSIERSKDEVSNEKQREVQLEQEIIKIDTINNNIQRTNSIPKRKQNKKQEANRKTPGRAVHSKEHKDGLIYNLIKVI